MPSLCSAFQWPPPYCLKQSSRAKYLRLKIDPSDGLCLICPSHISQDEAINFLHANQSWVKKNWHLIARAHQPFEWPKHVYLAAYDQRWRFEFNFSVKTAAIRSCSEDLIDCQMSTPDPLLFQHMFRRWLIRTARSFLKPDMEQLSELLGLPFNRLSIRYQKTCWGSCSIKKNINLNAKLLFYPKEVVRYVMIHELCHTIYMDHSPSFWKMLSNYDEDYRTHIKQLKDLSYLPLFLPN